MVHVSRAWYQGILLGMLLCCAVAGLARAGEPQEKVRETTDAVLAILQDKTLQAPEQAEARREKMRQAVFKRFGLEEMAQRALGQHWQKRSPAEKKEFTALFGELLERSYINKIESFTSEQKIRYVKETIEQDGFASVSTVVDLKRDSSVDVEYRLVRRDGTWQVYDIIIEGVSLVNNYRTQFNNIVSQESYNGLMKKLKLKLEQERAGTPSKG